MKNEIESQLVSLREELNTFESQLRDLEIQRDIAVKEAVEPLFKMHGILEIIISILKEIKKLILIDFILMS